MSTKNDIEKEVGSEQIKSQEPIQDLAGSCEYLEAQNRELLSQLLKTEIQRGKVRATTALFCLFKKLRTKKFEQFPHGDDVKKILQACRAHKCVPLATDNDIVHNPENSSSQAKINAIPSLSGAEEKGWDEVVDRVCQILGEPPLWSDVAIAIVYLNSIICETKIILKGAENLPTGANFVSGPGPDVLM